MIFFSVFKLTFCKIFQWVPSNKAFISSFLCNITFTYGPFNLIRNLIVWSCVNRVVFSKSHFAKVHGFPSKFFKIPSNQIWPAENGKYHKVFAPPFLTFQLWTRTKCVRKIHNKNIKKSKMCWLLWLDESAYRLTYPSTEYYCKWLWFPFFYNYGWICTVLC